MISFRMNMNSGISQSEDNRNQKSVYYKSYKNITSIFFQCWIRHTVQPFESLPPECKIILILASNLKFYQHCI